MLRRLLRPLVVVVLVATACGGDPAVTAADDPSTDGAGGAGAPVEQIASTPREDVPSALDDATHDELPDPLIDLARVPSGGPPPDGITSIDDPRFQSADAVDWIEPTEAVVVLELAGEARAYPIQILTWHELVNDTIADVPVTVSYCPLCNSALAYDRRLGDRVLDFGTSGNLFNSSMVMYDRQTESLWTHFDGTAVAGVLAGAELATFPIATVSWDDFRSTHPDGLVLTRETGVTRDYGRNPYEGYDDPATRPFLFDGEIDDRLDPKARVIVVRDPAAPAVALDRGRLAAERIVEFEAHGRALVAVLDPGTASPLDREEIAAGYDQGAVGVFENRLDGSPLSLTRVEAGFRDESSGRVFDVLGTEVEGGSGRLTPVEHLDTFWFAIAAFDAGVVLV